MVKRICLFLIITFVTFGQGEELISENLEVKTEAVKDYNVPFVNALKELNYQRLANQTKSIALLSLGTMGVLYTLPESFTGWEKGDFKNAASNYKDNMTDRGAVWDPDNIFFNFVGHPYVGAVYYIAARKSGFDEFDSFLYSFGMSSFFWEMGIEAFAEAPSIQDIVTTPGAGAILGEYLFGLEHKILKNNGKVLNSKFLGRTSLILIDPIGTLANVMGYNDEDVMGSWTFAKNKNNDLQLGYTLQMDF